MLVAALLLIFTAYRNTDFPDWTDSRLGVFQQLAHCVDTKTNGVECDRAKDYVMGFLTAPGSQKVDLSDSELALELREQINAFIKQRTDALSLRLPFFGITIDMNDLGLVSGLLLIAILFVLYANLKSETDDLIIAWKKTARTGQPKRHENLQLLLMSQVLASPAKSRIGVGQGLYLLFFVTPLLHLAVAKSDWYTYPVAELLEGKLWARIDTGTDFLTFLLVLTCSIYCFLQQRKLNHVLDDMLQDKDPMDAKVMSAI